jgi:lipopolysaccharide biosynthesis glycosyltransferase
LAQSAPDIVVAFLYVGALSRICQIMVASVRAAMPGARIVQMSDYETKKVTGVDEVVRKHWDRKFLMPYRLLHLKDFAAEQAIFLDADVVVQKDLGPLFQDEFDVALTYRDETDPSLRNSPEAYELMPFNAGVVLARASGKAFWDEAYQLCLNMPEDSRRWFGDQLAIKEVAARTTLRVRQYPCALYHYSPGKREEDLGGKYVVHYKGDTRKTWMQEQWSHLLPKSR